MILVFTGNGKGKTTAALGQALRSVGEGKTVLMVQFIKGPWKSGEDMLLENSQFSKSAPSADSGAMPAEGHVVGLQPNFQIRKTGIGFVGILGDTHTLEEHRKAAEGGFALAKKEVESGKWNMVILDEINNAVQLNLISKEKVLELVSISAQKLEHFILTGRDAPQEFIDIADIVTEMRDVKHVFEKGIRAKRGLEY